ncbi:hypothetical protein [Micromonospora sp. RTP1Z1]|uniref:hypothetical protein n=1 Tax=Micromonospora sp. RTP1Z1 TaxID=2994043 RepID=UPI0029C96ABF|nr:hypothetical protein [Micromonospora sp. RTP1Z1]
MPFFNPPSINWDTVATAGATAAFVTLAVEYMAKPRLEARKERVLEDARLRRDLVTAMMDLSLSASIIISQLPDEASAEVKQSLREERKRHYERMSSRINALHDEAGRYARAFKEPKRTGVLRYLNCVKGVVLSPRTRHRQAEVVHSLAVPAVTILEGTLWWPIPYAKAWMKLEGLVADTEVPADGEEAVAPHQRRPRSSTGDPARS